MAESFNLHNLILLINQEIQSAVQTGTAESESMRIQQVRVRMGQSATEPNNQNISLTKTDYPLAENGWLLDVIYQPQTMPAFKTTNIPSAETTAPSRWREALAPMPTTALQGIGEKRYAKLAQKGIYQLQDFLMLNPLQLSEHPAWLRNAWVQAQTLLSDPPLPLPNRLLSVKIPTLIHSPHLLNEYVLSDTEQLKLLFWLYQMEMLLDNDLLQERTFGQLLQIFDAQS